MCRLFLRPSLLLDRGGELEPLDNINNNHDHHHNKYNMCPFVDNHNNTTYNTVWRIWWFGRVGRFRRQQFWFS